HVDDLAIHAELLEVARRPAGLLGDLLAGAQHPDRYRERLRSNVELKLPISRLDVDHGRRLPVQPTTFRMLALDGGAPAPWPREIACNGCRIRSAPEPTTIRGGSTCSRPARVTALPSGSRSRTSPACSGRSPRPSARPAATSAPSTSSRLASPRSRAT